MEKKWPPLAERFVSLSRNKLFLAGIFFKNWIPPNFSNGFHYQKESSNSVSISRDKTTF